MKLKNLFHHSILTENEEKNLIGMTIDGKLIDEKTLTETWPRYFRCNTKQLTSLFGAPAQVNGSFSCERNRLKTLEGSPRVVSGYFSCNHNRLKTLKGAPKEVGGSFLCSNNKLVSLEYAPTYINGSVSINRNEITSLHNVHKIIKKMNGSFIATRNPIKSHILGLLLIDGITEVELDNMPVQNIINHGIKNKKHWTDVQAELEEAGFEEYAQL